MDRMKVKEWSKIDKGYTSEKKAETAILISKKVLEQRKLSRIKRSITQW